MLNEAVGISLGSGIAQEYVSVVIIGIQFVAILYWHVCIKKNTS